MLTGYLIKVTKMGIIGIIILLLNFMKINKAKTKDYENLKKFVSNSNIFKGNRKKIYTKINKFKNT